jgi:hypothetical protein
MSQGHFIQGHPQRTGMQGHGCSHEKYMVQIQSAEHSSTVRSHF